MAGRDGAPPYRMAADMPEELPGFGMIGLPAFTLEPFGGEYPSCPMCTGHSSGPGKICNGKRSFWSRTQLCPVGRLHFHPRCNRCEHVWLMSTRTEAVRDR